MKTKFVYLAGYVFFIFASLLGMASNVVQITSGHYLTNESFSLGQLIMFIIAFGLTSVLLLCKFISLLTRTMMENKINKNQ